ncbi:hypothetical protein [Kosakonia pseudosacchari]|uniref:Uncharacterized protein n=1 Tax=Kosakonia pseudosacchari TaxID=1646340 RepID=A0ABX4INX0_9ENTR|nr:hypothetical protein [Kosakonia pseudosacchari]PDO86153.1 hypothetical protein BK796_11990 [Kosakonia pseudosacchari]
MTAATPAMLVLKPFKNMLALFASLPTGYLFIRVEVAVLNGTAHAKTKRLQDYACGGLEESKLTAKPHSFIESGVDSH